MKKSLWQKDNSKIKFNSIDKNIITDILIIGGGMTGISLAYNLINSKYNITLLEAEKLANGVTAKSTGKITYLQELIYQDIISAHNFEIAKLYYEAQKDAIRIIKKNIKDNNIECNLTKSSTITFTSDEKEISKFDKEEEILDKLGVKYYTDKNILKDKEVKRYIMVNNTYVFHPVKYLNALIKIIKKSKNINIYENSRAVKIKKEEGYYTVISNNHTIKTKKIVLACNYPFFTLPGLIPLKTYLEKSYITATKVLKIRNINGIANTYPTKSFRYHEDDNKYFIYLTGSSKICDKLDYKRNYDNNQKESKQVTGIKPTYEWTNMDVMTNDYLPLIGKISENDSNVLIGTGYNTWGMTNGTISAKILCDLINSKKNKYEKVFDPTRNINLNQVKNFISNTLISNIKAYGLNLIKKNPSWYKDKAFVTKIDGKRVGIYFDNNGNKHVVSNICPHLKCFLTFNEVDKTWDCPCHGSRFDVDGNIIKSPSINGISTDNKE